MAKIIQQKIIGVESVLKALQSIPQEFRSRGERAALRGGSAPINKAAKANAAKSKDTGLLLKSIGVSVKKNRKSGQLTARVGPRSGFRQEVTRTDKRTGRKYKQMANPVNYAHLVEYGTSHSAAKPFIRPAIASTEGQIVDAMAAGLEKALRRALSKKLGRKS